MKPQLPETDELRHEMVRTGVCPTCGAHASFVFRGEQHWPEKVAKAHNLPTIMTVWECKSCETTLMETSLIFD